MARGWESKGVEQQQEESAALASDRKAPRTPAQAAAARQRDGLRMRRNLVLRQLEAAQEGRRAQLEAALKDLDYQLDKLG
jgi:hypothetical protein